MPRLARSVFSDIPHHITQRGNRQEDVFFSDKDREIYLKWLAEYCQKWKVDILAYCLMTNHIHLILKPKTKNRLQQVLKPLHMRYAQRINKSNGWKGHLWQGRFFSSPLDEAYTWSAIRYVERNPVRAKMVKEAEDYSWSSAPARCGLVENPLLMSLDSFGEVVTTDGWSDWLALPEDEQTSRIIDRNVEKGLPCGTDRFIETLEKLAERPLKYFPQGRPPKKKG
ncbi:MAG TPA: transposase [Gammaproteobacteria bacterium]|nr:transposase [Gammaproteobacteria bacterium]